MPPTLEGKEMKMPELRQIGVVRSPFARPRDVERPRYAIPPPRGLFATRSPFRVDPIGLTVVRLLEREGPVLRVKGVDMVDGTPVPDLKPCTRRDRKSGISCGWLDDTVIPPAAEEKPD